MSTDTAAVRAFRLMLQRAHEVGAADERIRQFTSRPLSSQVEQDRVLRLAALRARSAREHMDQLAVAFAPPGYEGSIG